MLLPMNDVDTLTSAILAVLSCLPLVRGTNRAAAIFGRYVVERTSLEGFTVGRGDTAVTLDGPPMAAALARRLVVKVAPVVATVAPVKVAAPVSRAYPEALISTVLRSVVPMHATAKLAFKRADMAHVERVEIKVTPKDGASWREATEATAMMLCKAGLLAVAEYGACRVVVMHDLAA